VKNVRGINEEDLTWSEFERLFKKKHFLKGYIDEINMGSMIDDEYTRRFLELLRYVLYLKEKAKI